MACEDGLNGCHCLEDLAAIGVSVRISVACDNVLHVRVKAAVEALLSLPVLTPTVQLQPLA